MRRPRSSRTLREVFQVLNGITNREALSQFARIHRELLKRSPVIVCVSAKLCSEVGMIWGAFGCGELGVLAAIRFSVPALTFLAAVLRCAILTERLDVLDASS